ncbi:MAG TPA: cytochrome c oxidase assembly protein [Pseudomonas xinjiangensis]|uniref:Cytochrome c oxidase assembly protein n=2 Tax=root TaxID=1 RepID=A0A7V1FRM1_9GAMM|nr:cytochrome c oxidase assembly protein [Halopseudomonas xinjiangensis]HEC46874.1 cytochrome c oxidase assembly protein [Halopseudomonas xinjiangensis]
MYLIRKGLLWGLGIGMSQPALAHSPLTSTGQSQIAALTSAAVLGGFWLLYLLGSSRFAPKRRHAICFHLTTLLCGFAVLGPLDEWAKTSTAAHMTQHMLFMVVIAPLWVLSRPLPQLSAGGGRGVSWIWTVPLRLAQFPMYSAYLHGFVIWFWHTPTFYMLAVEHPWWHVVEHLFFLVTAGVFWWAVLKSSRNNAPWAMLALLLTLMHTGFLGAILTFAQAPLYGEARSLGDQQLAGMIMWVVGAVPYMAAALWVANRWFGQLQQRPSDASCDQDSG